VGVRSWLRFLDSHQITFRQRIIQRTKSHARFEFNVNKKPLPRANQYSQMMTHIIAAEVEQIPWPKLRIDRRSFKFSAPLHELFDQALLQTARAHSHFWNRNVTKSNFAINRVN